MAQKRRTSQTRRAGLTVQKGREWVGGRFTAPFHITDRAEPYRPTFVAWIEAPDGFVVGHDVSLPEEEHGALGRALAEAMQHPLVGPARRPSAIRVANADLAAEVKAVVGDLIPVTIAATPELDQLADVMFESMVTGAGPNTEDPQGVEEASYFENGRVSPAAVADLFVAARLLCRTAPWEVANDQQVLRLDIPDLDVEGACVSIVGALGDSLGLLIFPSLAGFDAFLEAASNFRLASSRIDLGAAWLSLTFTPGAELPAPMRCEVADHGWPALDEMSYPQVEHRDPDGLLRPLTERDVRIASACATSLSAFFVTNREAFEREDGEPISQSYSDDDGRVVRFTLPYEAFPLFDVGADSRAATLGSTDLVRRDTILGRVTAFECSALLCGIHPRPLPPADAAEVVRRARSRLRRKRAVPVDRLQENEKIGVYLIRRWEETVAELDRRRAVPPALRNTDGDPVLLTVDRFELDRADRSEVEALLATLPDVDPPRSGRRRVGSCYRADRRRNGVHRDRSLAAVAQADADRVQLQAASRYATPTDRGGLRRSDSSPRARTPESTAS